MSVSRTSHRTLEDVIIETGLHQPGYQDDPSFQAVVYEKLEEAYLKNAQHKDNQNKESLISLAVLHLNLYAVIWLQAKLTDPAPAPAPVNSFSSLFSSIFTADKKEKSFTAKKNEKSAMHHALELPIVEGSKAADVVKKIITRLIKKRTKAELESDQIRAAELCHLDFFSILNELRNKYEIERIETPTTVRGYEERRDDERVKVISQLNLDCLAIMLRNALQRSHLPTIEAVLNYRVKDTFNPCYGQTKMPSVTIEWYRHPVVREKNNFLLSAIRKNENEIVKLLLNSGWPSYGVISTAYDMWNEGKISKEEAIAMGSLSYYRLSDKDIHFAAHFKEDDFFIKILEYVYNPQRGKCLEVAAKFHLNNSLKLLLKIDNDRTSESQQGRTEQLRRALNAAALANNLIGLKTLVLAGAQYDAKTLELLKEQQQWAAYAYISSLIQMSQNHLNSAAKEIQKLDDVYQKDLLVIIKIKFKDCATCIESLIQKGKLHPAVVINKEAEEEKKEDVTSSCSQLGFFAGSAPIDKYTENQRQTVSSP